jgi:hypothetical protein
MSDKKIEQFWRNATAADIAKVMKGETVEARFRDPSAGWGDWVWFAIDNSTLFLAGWKAGEWFDHEGDDWTHCQVYDPPQWWLDKPDPGEGWRILHPDERVEKGDEYYSSANNMWLLSGSPDTCDCKQANFPYRRRIEAVEPEPKHYVLRVGDTFETPSGQLIKVVSPGVEQIEFKLKAGFKAKLPNGQTITATEKGFEVKHD